MSGEITTAEETGDELRAANLQAFIDEMHAEPIRRTVADDLDPGAVERAARAAAEHIGWQAGMYDAIRAALAAAGLLVTPEHDAKVAARALREAAAAFLIGRYQPQGVRQSTDAWVRDGQELLDALATWQAARMPSVEQVAEVLCEPWHRAVPPPGWPVRPVAPHCPVCAAKAAQVAALWGAP